MSHTQMNPPWLDAMMNPLFYPHPVDKVELVQTHISWVFLAGAYVYKIKKPVNFGFLDFTSLEKRREFCNKELSLNQRLCPDIYLNIIALKKKTDTGYGIADKADRDDEEIIEWILKMKRMPQEEMMQSIIAEHRLSTHHIKMITARLIPFYQRLIDETKNVDGKNQGYGSADAIKFNTDENFAQTASFVGKLLSQKVYDDIVSYTNTFLAANKGLFESRITNCRIVEGHGDLYSANICFDQGKNDVHIFDCIEFNERFRFGDVASDVAFLAMDLDYHGYPDLSQQFIETVAAELNDPELLSLIRFYKCYRAFVRGKIGCFTWASEEISDDQRNFAKSDADRYFGLALRYATPSLKPVLYVVYGLSGSGKTTFASQVAKRLGISHYNSDIVRKKNILKTNPAEKHNEAFNKGIYRKDITEKTYTALSRLAAAELMAGRSVVVDATFIEPAYRIKMETIAMTSDANIRFILCSCPETEIRKRLQTRSLQAEEASDGRWEVYVHQASLFNETEKINPEHLIKVDTSKDYKNIIEAIIESC